MRRQGVVGSVGELAGAGVHVLGRTARAVGRKAVAVLQSREGKAVLRLAGKGFLFGMATALGGMAAGPVGSAVAGTATRLALGGGGAAGVETVPPC